MAVYIHNGGLNACTSTVPTHRLESRSLEMQCLECAQFVTCKALHVHDWMSLSVYITTALSFNYIIAFSRLCLSTHLFLSSSWKHYIVISALIIPCNIIWSLYSPHSILLCFPTCGFNLVDVYIIILCLFVYSSCMCRCYMWHVSSMAALFVFYCLHDYAVHCVSSAWTWF